jgi:hypothetical protein
MMVLFDEQYPSSLQTQRRRAPGYLSQSRRTRQRRIAKIVASLNS